jgi:hypothetical protein
MTSAATCSLRPACDWPEPMCIEPPLHFLGEENPESVKFDSKYDDTVSSYVLLGSCVLVSAGRCCGDTHADEGIENAICSAPD